MFSRSTLLYFLFFLSGIAGLGYQIAWTRMFTAGLGHEMPSMLAVVSAFFGGIALGAVCLDGKVTRSRQPGRWYAVLEFVIGVWALVTLLLIPFCNSGAAQLLGPEPSALRHWLVAFALPFLLLLPATAAMGATLPAMEQFLGRLKKTPKTVAGLYGVNTAGAVAGTTAAAFLLLPRMGFRATIAMFAALNLFCALAVILGVGRGESRRDIQLHESEGAPGGLRLDLTLAVTGLLGIGFEVLCVRVVAQVLEGTIYTFAAALSVYLVGTALGAAFYQRYLKNSSVRATLAILLQLLTMSCLAVLIILKQSRVIYESLRLGFGEGFAGSVCAELGLAALIFLVPTFFMGSTFSLLLQASRKGKGGVGRALAFNTLGSAAAPVFFGVAMLLVFGARWSLILLAVSYLMLLPEFSLRRMTPTILSLAILPFLPGNLNLITVTSGSRVIAFEEGVMAGVSVIEDSNGLRVLRVNDRFNMGGTATQFGERRQAHIPLLLHGNPRRALFLGVGSGITAVAASDHPGLTVHAVELLPEVLEVVPFFVTPDRTRASSSTPIFKAGDARRFVRAAEENYDVIVGDLFHPARDGAGVLYTREHFETIRARLEPGGIFCQWLPLYQLDLDTIRLIARTFTSVFQTTRAFIGHFNTETPILGLVGTQGDITYDPDWMRGRVSDPDLERALEEVALANEFTLFGCYLGGGRDIRRFAGTGPLNTDDHLLVVFQAPLFTYGKHQPGYGRLMALLETLDPRASELMGSLETAQQRNFEQRLNRYLKARDLFLHASVKQMSSEFESIPLFLKSAASSRDFRTAYVVAYQIAMRLEPSDPGRAREILEELASVDPTNPLAYRALERLNHSSR